MQFNKENTPNAAKLMESLRHSGYDMNIAVADLVDNSLDADATKVDIVIEKTPTNGFSVAIMDNGRGMGEEVLAQALRLGSDTVRNVESDLGRFGMGMVTASISLAKRIEVYTKQAGDEMLTSVMDLDEMVKTNTFAVYRESSAPQEKSWAAKHGLVENGTILLLKKCDRAPQGDFSEVCNSLSKHLGETYRYFIRAGKSITINGEPVRIVDPMWQDGVLTEEYNRHSREYSNENYTIKSADGVVHTITVKVFELPELDRSLMRKLRISSRTQGFYFLRNFRQIANGIDLGLWEKHPTLNRVRVEILFSGKLDQVMGINYTKHEIKPVHALLDKLRDEVMPQIETLRKRYEKERVHSEANDIVYDVPEKIIAEKAKLLEKADVVSRVENIVDEENTEKRQYNKRLKPADDTTQKPSLHGVARFETISSGATGPIFEAEKQGKTTVIQWNVDHPFYERFLLANRDNPDMTNAVSFLAYSMGEATLKYGSKDEDAYDMLENIMSSISTNLRCLLS